MSEFSSHQKRLDFAGFIVLGPNEEKLFSFGKYKGRKVTDVFKENPGYYSWIQKADFPLYTKKVLVDIKESMLVKKQNSTVEDLKNKFNNKV